MPTVIAYIQRCFTYCIKQNKGKPSSLLEGLSSIVPQAIGDHSKCKEWFRYRSNLQNYHYSDLPGGKDLKGDDLQAFIEDALQPFLTKKAAKKMAPVGSSQRNECLNSFVSDSNTTSQTGIQKNSKQKPPHSDSPAPKTPHEIPRKKRIQKNEPDEEKEVSLVDIFDTIDSLTMEIQSQHDTLGEKLLSLENHITETITEKFASMMEDMKVKVREEVSKEKKSLRNTLIPTLHFLRTP